MKKIKKQIVKNTPLVEQMSKPNQSSEDPNGSYTGTGLNANEIPIQDADDLWWNFCNHKGHIIYAKIFRQSMFCFI